MENLKPDRLDVDVVDVAAGVRELLPHGQQIKVAIFRADPRASVQPSMPWPKLL